MALFMASTHVRAEVPDLTSFERDRPDVYEPAEDTYLLLDAIEALLPTLAERAPRFCVEVGPGSGAVTSFLAKRLHDVGVADAVVLAIDVNPEACKATLATVEDNRVQDRVVTVTGNLTDPLLGVEEAHSTDSLAHVLRAPAGAAQAALAELLASRPTREADVLVFNPPYVPTPSEEVGGRSIEASWAGGARGREVIDQFLERLPASLARPHGVCLMVVVQENDPAEIASILRDRGLSCERVVHVKAFNERLSVLRIEWAE
jgi:release factor glutamine methyltransferase